MEACEALVGGDAGLRSTDAGGDGSTPLHWAAAGVEARRFGTGGHIDVRTTADFQLAFGARQAIIVRIFCSIAECVFVTYVQVLVIDSVRDRGAYDRHNVRVYTTAFSVCNKNSALSSAS